MSIDEVAVYITKDHLGRAAMVRGADGFIRIYVHWIWAEDARETFRVAAGGRTTWETIERRWRTSMKEETQWVVFMEASTKRGRRSSVCLVLQTRVCRMLENSKHQAYPTNDLTIMATVY